MKILTLQLSKAAFQRSVILLTVVLTEEYVKHYFTGSWKSTVNFLMTNSKIETKQISH